MGTGILGRSVFARRVSFLAASVAATALLAPGAARAQSTGTVLLPTIDVSSSRLGAGSTIVGTASTVISAEEIQKSPAQNLTDILKAQAGIQIQHVSAGVNGARDSVDLRGFGATASSNVLVLVNGRRFNDFDLQGFDFSAIPLNAIQRIEVTRGNSGAVLYGDGAVGGVINIITKTGAKLPPSLRVEGGFGSFRDREGRVTASGSQGPWSGAIDATAIRTDGYRQNGYLRQKGLNGDIRYTGDEGGVYFNVLADDQKLGTPGGRLVDTTKGINELVTDRAGTSTPNDYANKQGQNFTLGVTRNLTPGLELILDGSVRLKQQQAELFYNGSAYNGVDTNMKTASVTPRLKFDGNVGGMPVKVLTGIDYYHTAYTSDRSQDFSSAPYHVYDLKQDTAAVYANGTLSVRPDTDITLGGRYQRDNISANDTYDASAPGAYGAQGIALDRGQDQWAAQLGIEHRFNDVFAVFGHVAHAFRVPNADERIGLASPVNFDLRTQTSNEIEGGARLHVGRFKLQSSVYDMELNDEIAYSAATFVNVNLDPTRHWGVETNASLQLTDTVSLTGNLTYTRATFREGQYAGHDIPLISRWTANAGLTWDVWRKWLVYDVMVHYTGKRRLDNDNANVQPLIPAHAVVDMRIGGDIPFAGHAKTSGRKAFWSFTVQNLFNDMYYDYGIASTTTVGRFNAYPQPGRTFMFRAGVALE
ncbi:MAG: TonB-dependent receptor [Pseudolabrys sp.]